MLSSERSSEVFISNEIKKNYIAVIITWTSDVKRQTHSSEQCLIPACTFLQTADGGAY